MKHEGWNTASDAVDETVFDAFFCETIVILRSLCIITVLDS